MAIEFITTGELCRICKRIDGSPLPTETAHEWVKGGAITCSIGGHGKGDQRKFTLIEGLQAAVFGALQSAGYSRGQALGAAKILHSIDRPRLEREFAGGRHYIAICGSDATGLLSHNQVAALMRKNLRAIEESEQTGTPLTSPFAVDLRMIWTNVLAVVSALENEQAALHASRKSVKELAVAR